MRWIKFEQDKWANQPLPPGRRHLLVQIAARPDQGFPPAVAVGYMRFASGEEDSPVFTIPGVGGPVVAWCDCLPADFMAPHFGQETRPTVLAICAAHLKP